MHGWRASIVLLILLMATVTGMVWLLRPSTFTRAGNPPILEASAVHEDRGRATEDPDDEPDGTIAPQGPRLYVVLDDAGHDLDDLRQFMPFPGVFTVAILPGLRYSREAAQMVIALGHEAILHQPMEATGGNDPGPGAILVAHSDSRIRQTLTSNLSSMPGVVGVNNHMGSRVTADERVMTTVANTLRRHRLFFLDSRTTHLSVAADTTRAVAVPTLERDVFLDNVREAEAISVQLAQGLSIAREQGHAVMIGHVTSPELARVLIDRYSELVEAGFVFRPLSDLINGERGEPREQLINADSGN